VTEPRDFNPAALDRWIEGDPYEHERATDAADDGVESCPECGNPLDTDGKCGPCYAYERHVDQQIDEAKEDG
jgi:hypothetical protein